MISFILDKIHLRNVRCYGDDGMDMDFPLNNLTVFTGHVGSGKSTILKAVSLALYGEDGGAKNEKLAIDDIINERNKKNLEIELYFHAVDSETKVETKYEIHLFHKHSKYNNKLVFVKDGKDISLESKTATYELIEKTLIPKNVYHNIYYFTQQAKNFFTALPNSEQKEIFNAILDLSEYDDYYENVKNVQRGLELDINTATVKMEADKKNVCEYGQTLDQANERLELMERDNAQQQEALSIEIKDVDDTIVKLKSELGEDALSKAEAEIADSKVKRAQEKLSFEKEVVRITKEIEDNNKNFELAVGALKNKYVQLRLERSKSLNEEEQKIKLDNQRLDGEYKGVAQKIELDFKIKRDAATKEYEPKFTELESNIKIMESNLHQVEVTKMKDLQDAQKTAQEKVDELKKKLVDVKLQINTCESQKTNFETEITTRKTSIEQYTKDLGNPDAVCSLCGQKLSSKEHIQKHIDELSERVKEFSDRLSEVTAQHNGLVASRTEIENQLIGIKNEFENDKKAIVDNAANMSTTINEELKAVRDRVVQLKAELQKIIDGYFAEEPEVKKEQTKTLCDQISKNNETLKTIEKSKLEIDNTLRSEYSGEYSVLKESNAKEYENKQKLILEQNEQIDKIDVKYDEIDAALARKRTDVKVKMATIQTYEDTKKNKLNQLENLQSDSYYDVIKDDIKRKTDVYQKQLLVVKEDEKKFKELDEKNKILEFWRVAFSDSGIKSMLIDAAIPHMNECVAKELEFVAPGKFSVSFDTLSETKTGKIRDKFNINIVNNERGSTGHKKLSGGEKRIIDLCCMSALRSLAEKLYNKRFCHIFYDEILDSLDDECKQQFCENIRRQSADGCNVTLVTHDCPQDCEPDRVFPF